ncbi:hypothetical protein [Streptomyces sp. NPDC004267]|uniref:hypothetical protein n=1 Tax=Streptomyces sp. NPDC004267 TaxID=3364694 RepID=UPI003696D32F
MSEETAKDTHAAARHERFGALPGRIRFEDMTTEAEVDPGGTGAAAYDPENSWKFYSCVALDLGL